MCLGFYRVQGQIQSSSFDSSPNWSQWSAMRPLVLCDHEVMTLTASGEGLTHLLVDRGKMLENLKLVHSLWDKTVGGGHTVLLHK